MLDEAVPSRWIFASGRAILRAMKIMLAVMLTLGSIFAAQAQLHNSAIEYKDGDTVLEGYLAYDDSAAQGKRPGVIIVHQWKGLGDYEKKRAEMLAKLGYVAFAVDIYGKGIRPQFDAPTYFLFDDQENPVASQIGAHARPTPGGGLGKKSG